MGTIILYSSLTGNTKSVAEAMASVMPEGYTLCTGKRGTGQSRGLRYCIFRFLGGSWHS